MASLKKIASELDVSYTLVSKVLSGRLGTTGVSADTREAILKKAKELNYTPNRLAVALKAGRKGAVGIFLHHLGSPGSEVSDRLLRGLAEGLEKSRYRMWLRFFQTDEEFLAACDDKLKSEIDGLVVAGVQHSGLISRLRDIDQKELPVVSIFSDTSETARNLTTNVAVDYEEQGFLATKHLLEQGCRRLAHLRTIEKRYRGFVRAHREAKVSVVQSLVIPAERFLAGDGKASVTKLLKSRETFDGIVCQSDAQAAGAVNELIRRGIDVPGEIRVTGIDDSPIAENCIVPLTSVSSGMREAGSKAVECLLEKIGGGKVQPVYIEPELKLRQSSR